MALDAKTLAYVKTAKRIEKEFGVKACVIRKNEKSMIPWITSSEGFAIYIIAGQEKREIVEKIHQKYQMSGVMVQHMYPVEEMLKIIRANPARIRNELGGMGFLVPFFFNEEVYGKYSAEFTEKFKAEFGPQLNREINARLERLAQSEKRSVEQYNAFMRRVKEREKRLVGPIEERDLSRQMKEMAEHINKKKGKVLIVLDKSGRPLGIPLKKILREAYKRDVKVFFLDPKKARVAGIEKLTLASESAKTLAKEHPYLVKAVRNKQVMLVDDQIWQGKALTSVAELLKPFKPKGIDATYLSAYPTEPQPSWRSHQMHHIREPENAGREFVSKQAELSAYERTRLNKMRARLNRAAENAVKRIAKNKTKIRKR